MFGVNYRSVEELSTRYLNFKSNLAKIKADNVQYKGKTQFGVNHMSDWSEAEFDALLGSTPPPKLGNSLTGSPALEDVSDITSGFGR